MSQHDYLLDNQTGASFRSDLNNALAAIATLNSGATEPSTTYAFQLWADTANNLLKIRNAANSGWVSIGTLSATNLGLLALSGGTLTGALLVALGTVSAPGVAFSGDSNTGLYSSGADILGLVAAGVEYLRVSSAGVDLLGTGAVKVPVGTTAQQPTPSTGMLRYNSTTGKFEGYHASSWKSVGGGPSLGTDSVIRTNAQTISEDITFAGTENGSTVGPVTIASTYTVTVTSGSTWVII